MNILTFSYFLGLKRMRMWQKNMKENNEDIKNFCLYMYVMKQRET